MSFSKAKIQRFNDVKAPLPGSAKTGTDKDKLKTKARNNFENSSENVKTDTGSSHSVPCFKTPTLLRKKMKKVSNNHTLKSKATESISTDQTLEALKEKIVECENKDAYIKDLTQQLEEFKEKISKFGQSKQCVDEKKEKYQQLIDNLKNEHEHAVKSLQEEFRLRLKDTISLKENIQDNLKLLHEEYQRFVSLYNTDFQSLKGCFSQLPSYFRKYSEKYEILLTQKQFELKDKENILKALQQNTIDMEKQHSVEIEKLRKEQQTEVQNLEFEMLKTMTELQNEKEMSANRIKDIEHEMALKILEMRNMFESEKEKIVSESAFQIKQMEETFTKSNRISEVEMEKQMSKLEAEWKTRLEEQQTQSNAILNECQTISEYNIINCELEKSAITKELKENIQELKKIQTNYDELSINFKKLENTYMELKSELDLNKQELIQTKKNLHIDLDEYTKKLNQLAKEKAAYEFTIKNSQATIDVLKRRLIHSDKDVEQLKEELSVCEKKLLDYEQKNLQLSTDLQQAQIFNEELEMQFESTIKLNCTDINNISAQLLKEVNQYKIEVIRHKTQMQEEKNLKKEIMQQLHDGYDMISRLKYEVEDIETRCSHYKFEVQQSQNELDDYHMREMDWNIIKDKLEFTIKELEDLLESKEQKISNLTKQMTQLKETSDSYCQLSEYYLQKVKEFEKDQEETGNIHKKYIEMSGKYDVLAWKYEQLEAENLQNKMQLMRLSEENSETAALKAKHDNQVALCNELEQKNEELRANIENRLKDETSLREEVVKMKAERDALLRKLQHFDDVQHKLENDDKRRTPKKSKKIKEKDEDSKNWMKKNNIPKEGKENLNSPNRTLNSNRIDSPLRDRN